MLWVDLEGVRWLEVMVRAGAIEAVGDPVTSGELKLASALLLGTLKVGSAAILKKFAKDEANEHFAKHGGGIMKVLGLESYNLKQYVTDANHVIKTGMFVPEMNAYVKLIGGSGSAKFGVVGISRDATRITTFHIKTAAELARLAPNLFAR